jgi:hypothetical protein
VPLAAATKHRNPRLAIITVYVNCNQSASVIARAHVTVWGRTGEHLHGAAHWTTIVLQPATARVNPGSTASVQLHLTTASVDALRRKTRETVTVTVTATSVHGSSNVTKTVPRLQGI